MSVACFQSRLLPPTSASDSRAGPHGYCCSSTFLVVRLHLHPVFSSLVGQLPMRTTTTVMMRSRHPLKPSSFSRFDNGHHGVTVRTPGKMDRCVVVFFTSQYPRNIPFGILSADFIRQARGKHQAKIRLATNSHQSCASRTLFSRPSLEARESGGGRGGGAGGNAEFPVNYYNIRSTSTPVR